MRRIIFLFLLMMTLNGVAEERHWTCNVYDYRFDMTVYMTMMANEEMMTDLSGYEVAAFINNQCHGIMELQTYNGMTYGVMRIYSMSNSSESLQPIIFKLYNRVTKQEYSLSGPGLYFSDGGIQGTPGASSRFSYSFVKGDLTGNGVADGEDVKKLSTLVVSNAPFVYEGDINGDGKVNIIDVTKQTDRLLSK